MRRRLLLDQDGTCFFLQTMTQDILGSIRRAVAECSPNVTTYLVCAGAGTLLYPTRVGTMVPFVESFPGSRHLHDAVGKGMDPFGMFLSALRQAGKETFITLRMNDVHEANNLDGWNISQFKRENLDKVVDPTGVANKTGDWYSYCFDYSHPEVRNYFLDLIREMADRYPINGILLDWMRFPQHLSGTPDQVWEKRRFLTEFISEVRKVLIVSKKNILLSARVPANPAGCRYLGLDTADWVQNGLVDFLVLSAFLTSDYTMPVEEFRREMGNHPVPIYATVEWRYGPNLHCPESLRAAALNLFDCGADGIYVFNFPGWRHSLAAVPYYWLADLDNPRSAAKKPLLFSISYKPTRVPYVDIPGQLPAPLPAGEKLELSLYLAKTVFPLCRALLLVHSFGDIEICVNGGPAEELPNSRRPEIFVEHTDRIFQLEDRPQNEDCRTFDVEPSSLLAGVNKLTLTNISGRKLEIRRVNLGVW